VNNRFVKIAASTTDWETLYKNSEDESLWELSYPYSGMHGGGPPKLTKLTERSASLKYNLGENT
jgi:hypothetical protein